MNFRNCCTVFVMLGISIIGCTKNKAPGTTSGTDKPGTSETFLTKTVVNFFDNTGQPTGSNYLTYSYDASGRLSKIGLENEPYTQFGLTIYDRDSKGRTIRITKTGFPVAIGDTSITLVNYKPGSDEVDHLYISGVHGKEIPDSIMFDYQNGQISATRQYYIGLGGQIVFGENHYFYNASGARTSADTYVNDARFKTHHVYTHDGKISPLVFGPEEALITSSVSIDNITSEVSTLASGQVTTFNHVFTYRDDGRPLTAVSGYSGDSAYAKYTYTYQ